MLTEETWNDELISLFAKEGQHVDLIRDPMAATVGEVNLDSMP